MIDHLSHKAFSNSSHSEYRFNIFCHAYEESARTIFAYKQRCETVDHKLLYTANDQWCYSTDKGDHTVVIPEEGRRNAAPSKIGQNLAELAPFSIFLILASMRPK